MAIAWCKSSLGQDHLLLWGWCNTGGVIISHKTEVWFSYFQIAPIHLIGSLCAWAGLIGAIHVWTWCMLTLPCFLCTQVGPVWKRSFNPYHGLIAELKWMMGVKITWHVSPSFLSPFFPIFICLDMWIVMLTKNNTGINYMLWIVDITLDQLAEAHFHKKINDTDHQHHCPPKRTGWLLWRNRYFRWNS